MKVTTTDIGKPSLISSWDVYFRQNKEAMLDEQIKKFISCRYFRKSFLFKQNILLKVLNNLTINRSIWHSRIIIVFPLRYKNESLWFNGSYSAKYLSILKNKELLLLLPPPCYWIHRDLLIFLPHNIKTIPYKDIKW